MGIRGVVRHGNEGANGVLDCGGLNVQSGGGFCVRRGCAGGSWDFIRACDAIAASMVGRRQAKRRIASVSQWLFVGYYMGKVWLVGGASYGHGDYVRLDD